MREADPDAKDYYNPSFLFLNGLCGMKERAGQGHGSPGLSPFTGGPLRGFTPGKAHLPEGSATR